MKVCLMLGLILLAGFAAAGPYYFGMNGGWVPNVEPAVVTGWAFETGATMPRVGMRLDFSAGDAIAHPDGNLRPFCEAGHSPLAFLMNASWHVTRPDGSQDEGMKPPAGLWQAVFTTGDEPLEGAQLNPENEWAFFVGRIVERYDADGLADAPGSPRLDYYSLWNEPDWLPWPERPTNPASRLLRGWYGMTLADLARLVFISHQAARYADPTAKVGLQICFEQTLGFLLDDAVYPAAQYLDFVDFHTYAGPGSDTLIERKEGLFVMLGLMKGEYKKRELPLPKFLCTECGYPGDDSLGEAYGPLVQRAAAPKTQLSGAAAGLVTVCWYGLMDPCWQNMGLLGDTSKLGRDGVGVERKPAYWAYRTCSELLSGLSTGQLVFSKELEVGDEARAYLFTGKTGEVLCACWAADWEGTPSLKREVVLSLPQGQYVEYHWDYSQTREEAGERTSDGRLALTVGIDPVYL